MKLRPVSFRYKQDPNGVREYGLIAEEVGRVYPELVNYSDDGKIQGVRYELFPALLLNELQRQNRENNLHATQIREQAREIKQQTSRIKEQAEALKKKEAQLETLIGRMDALEEQVRAITSKRLAGATQ